MKKRIKIVIILALVHCIIGIKVYCLDKLKNLKDNVSEKIDKAKNTKDKYKKEYDDAKNKVNKIKDSIKDGENKISTAKEKINEGYNKIFNGTDDIEDNDEDDSDNTTNKNITEDKEYIKWLKRMEELSPEKYKKLLITLIKYKKENERLNKILNNIYNDKTFILLTNITIDTK